jgi:hypothetical protein
MAAIGFGIALFFRDGIGFVAVWANDSDFVHKFSNL